MRGFVNRCCNHLSHMKLKAVIIMSANASGEIREVMINHEYGLHFRPADLFARTASKFSSTIQVYHNGQGVNGKSILDLATLAAECGSVLKIQAEGPDALQALEALVRLVESDFQTELPKSSSHAV